MIKTKEDLKKFRLKYGKTQEQFARDLGVSISYYKKVEGGRLAFYNGIKKSANDFKARIEAYEKANGAYIETVARCYCDSYDDNAQEQIKREDKEVNRILYCFALIAFIAIAGVILWIYKS